MIGCIGFVVYLFSIPYLEKDRSIQRYCILLTLSIVAMLWLVVADNLLVIFIGWELIGLISYWLISFWCQQTGPAQAGTKVWLINKFGSILLFMGILLLGSQLGSFSLVTLMRMRSPLAYSIYWLTLASGCILGGVFTKSAQFPFCSWLPSAMTAPTPASALLHAATMVSAGVYLLIRITPVMHTALLSMVAFIGSFTALMGAYAALAQRYLKSMLAYATISQLGYIMMAIGLGANSAAFIYLIIHAFCKACLFLCVGAVEFFLSQRGISANHDMQKMGGLIQFIPGVAHAYWLASLMLVGIPGLGDFTSKKVILAHTLHWAIAQGQAGFYLGYCVPIFGFITLLLTIVYLGRSYGLVFMGTPHWKYRAPIVSSKLPGRPIPLLMQLSILMLVLCSLGLCCVPLLFPAHYDWLWKHLATLVGAATMPSGSLQHVATTLSTTILIMGMIVLVMSFHPVSTNLLRHCSSLAQLSLQGWYLDALIGLVAQRVLRLSKITHYLEQKLLASFTQCIAISYVVLGHIIAWLDYKLVGNIYCLVTSGLWWLGQLYGYIQQSKLQNYLFWTYFGLGLLLVWWLYWVVIL